MDSTISHDPFAPAPQYVLYTYREDSGQLVCHAYGPTDEATAEAAGLALEQDTPGLQFMVLLLEPVSIPAPQPASAPAQEAPSPEGDGPPVSAPAADSGPESAPVPEAQATTDAIVPGVTPGYPVDATTGEPLALAPEEHQALGSVVLDPAEGSSDVSR